MSIIKVGAVLVFTGIAKETGVTKVWSQLTGIPDTKIEGQPLNISLADMFVTVLLLVAVFWPKKQKT